MREQKEGAGLFSRRNVLKGSAIFLIGGTVGRVSNFYPSSAAAQTAGNPPSLPWKWPMLDPLEAGRRAYRAYLEKKG